MKKTTFAALIVCFALASCLPASALTPTPLTPNTSHLTPDTSHLTPDTSHLTPSPTPLPPTETPAPTATIAPEIAAARVIETEMKGRAPQLFDASVGTYNLVPEPDGSYRVVNEKLGLDQRLVLVKDQYNERLTGEDGRTVFLKDNTGKWTVAPFFRWGEKRMDLGLVNEGKRYKTRSGSNIYVIIAAQLEGYGQPVEIEYQGERYTAPVAILWVGNNTEGQKILFPVVLFSGNQWIKESGSLFVNAYKGTSYGSDPNAKSNLNPVFSNNVSYEELEAYMSVGGMYIFSLPIEHFNPETDAYEAANTAWVEWLSGQGSQPGADVLGLSGTMNISLFGGR